jgi:hypothetical protein
MDGIMTENQVKAKQIKYNCLRFLIAFVAILTLGFLSYSFWILKIQYSQIVALWFILLLTLILLWALRIGSEKQFHRIISGGVDETK